MRKTISEEEAQKELDKYADDVSTRKVEKLLGKERKVRRLATVIKKLEPLEDDIVTAVLLIKDWATGKYEGIPWKSIAFLVGALIYLISPFDLIPDILPGGWTDDAAVLACAFKTVKNELEAYKAWKVNNDIVDVG